MLLTKTAKIRIGGNNKKYYESVGIVGKIGDYVEIPVELLTKGSEYRIDYVCDNCGKTFNISMYDYRQKPRTDGKDYCPNCKIIAIEKTCVEKYGTSCALGNEDIRKKALKTIREKYGVDNVMALNETKEKIKNTNLERYGTENAMQNEDVKSKMQNTYRERYADNNIPHKKRTETIIQKYGVDNIMKVPEFVEIVQRKLNEKSEEEKEAIKQKRKETNIERFGVDCTFRVEGFFEGCHIKYHQRPDCPTSKGQERVNKIIGGILNYQAGKYNLDMYFEEDKIYVEWDGGGHWWSVWHKEMTMEEFNYRQERRRTILLNAGMKEIRFISRKNRIPKDDVLLEMKDYGFHIIKDMGFDQVIFDIDESVVKYGLVIEDFKYF